MTKATTDQLDTFYKLSAALTGFEEIDLLGTGVGQEYLDELLRSAGEEHVKALLAAAKKAGDSTAELQKTIWNDADERFGPLARNIVLLWYLGSWYPLSESWHKQYRPGFDAVPEHVVSATAYQEALWAPAVGAHPRGAKPPGFGSWGKAPNLGGHDAAWVSEKRSSGKRPAKKKTSKQNAAAGNNNV